MSKGTIVQTVIVFLLVGIVACLGAFAVIASTANIKSTFKIEVENAGLKFAFNGTAEWAPDTNSNKNFTSVQSNTGLSKRDWAMPDIPFSTTRPVITQSVLNIEIINHNTALLETIYIEISGVAYDVNRTYNPRFQASVAYAINEAAPTQGQAITANNQLFRADNIAGNVEKITISIVYDLLLFNSSFDLTQNIKFTIGTEEVTE